MARKIVITSGKGGVGKSTVCLNLGVQLAKTGARVVMLDVDVGLNNLDIVSGIQQKIVFDIVDVIEGRTKLVQALINDTNILDLYYLPSCHTYNTGKVSAKALQNVVKELSDSFDYILIDCPAGIDFGFHRAVFCSSEALIVTTPHISAVADADKVATLLCHYNLDGVGVVVNRVKNKFLAPLDISSALKLKLVGSIPESETLNIKESTSGIGLCDDFKLNRAFKQLANNIFYADYSYKQQIKL